MLVTKTNNTMYDIKKLRHYFNDLNNKTSFSYEKIGLLNKFSSKLKRKNFFSKFILSSYKSEVIKLSKVEIELEKEKIDNLKFNYQKTNNVTLEKIKTLFNQLKKMKVFYKLDGSVYNLDKIDLHDIEKHQFSFYKRNELKEEFLYLEDSLYYFEFHSMFIGCFDLYKKNKLLELFSYDNISIKSKKIYFHSKQKKAGFKLKETTYLYTLDDGSIDESATNNYLIYIYELRCLKITFDSKKGLKEFVFLGNDLDKMTIFYKLLNEYKESLTSVYYDIPLVYEFVILEQSKILELFRTDKTYSWAIFDILKENTNLDLINVSEIYKKYKLTITDLINITSILKKYGFIEMSLGLDYIPKYDLETVNSLYDTYLHLHKESLIKGEEDGC